jgi:ADP-ribosyl-[dinitrogen reductase] hydrolase
MVTQFAVGKMNRLYKELANGKEQPMSNDFRDKCKGAIIGTTIGDALFAPIEFSGKTNHRWIDKMEGGGSWGLPAGYYTDDTSMMLCIMQGYLDNPKHYAKSIATAFVKWWEEGLWSSTGHCFDIGSSCSSGLRKFKATGSLVNGSEHSRGCGGIMRFAPSWMIEYKESGNHNTARRLGAMLDINNIDHYNRECIGAIAKLANIYNAHLMDSERTDEVSEYTSWLDASGGFDARGCLETALWAFNTTHNFRDAVIASGNVGGDTDSVAAVCGGIAGSYYGYKAIPTEWLAALKDREKIEKFTERFLDATIGI